MITIIKRDGRKTNYDRAKVAASVLNAAKSAKQSIDENILSVILDVVEAKITELNKLEITVEKLQDFIQTAIYVNGLRLTKDAYLDYRKERNEVRETKSDIMKAIRKIGVHTDRDNGNVGNNFGAKLLRIASESNKWQNLANMPKHIAKAHEQGDYHLHDLDAFNLTFNCCSHSLEPLKTGFKTSYGTIRPAKRIDVAAELACILLQCAQNQMFGGQSIDDFDNDMAVFVKYTREEIYEEYSALMIDQPEEVIRERVEAKLDKVVGQAMQSVMYNLSTMESRSGSQIVFSSLNIGLPNDDDAALVCKHALIEYGKGLGAGEQLIFPNMVFAVKSGVNRNPGDPYYYLYKIACEVASRRLNPTFLNIDASYNLPLYEQGVRISTMGCRTSTVDNINGPKGAKRRGNIAPTTINLPRLGIEASLYQKETGCTDEEKIKFLYDSLSKMLDLTRESLLYRYSVLKQLKGKDVPFLTENNMYVGAEEIGPNDSIEPILKQGSYAIGFIGIHEMLMAAIGKHHGEDEKALEIADTVVRMIREYCDKYKEIDKLNWSCYAAPSEGLCGRFIAIDKAKYGVIKGVTDHAYYTNGYHINPGFKISVKEKIQKEAPFHELCNGGRISYIELDDYPTPEEIERIITWTFTNTNMGYIGINFHVRYCKECGQLLRTEEECPNCGSRKIQGVSRITGYLALDERFGAGKEAERADRVAHNNDSDAKIYANAKKENL
jgi:ribonucleoside-triphosphate reductase|nr:MAG TPA: anaerobic ribonucleoside triphosphate reductase [Caudoviricetes sp.]